MDIEMFGQLLPEQVNAPDSATAYGFAGPVTGTLPPLLSHQLIPNLGHAIKGPISDTDAGMAVLPLPGVRMAGGRRCRARAGDIVLVYISTWPLACV